ncbi:MAG: GxxExxY protein [Chlamydiia bacterium]
MILIEDLVRQIIGAGIEVHRHLGPGLFESTYEACLLHELTLSGLQVESQKMLPLIYKDLHINSAYRLDLVVENQIILEIKSVKELQPIHETQLLSYLRLSGYKLGLLLNFNESLLRNGIRRIIN